MGRTAYPNAYDLEARLTSAGFTVSESAELGIAAEAGRREFEGRVGRVMLAGESETRYYDPPTGNSDLVPIDDVVGTVTVGYQPDGSTLAAWTLNTEYKLGPRNAPALGQPYRYLTLAYGRYLSPLAFSYGGAIQVTGQFGYGLTIPEDAWTAMVLLGCQSLLADAQMESTGGASSWQASAAGYSETINPNAYVGLSGQWQTVIDRAVTRYSVLLRRF